MQKGGWLDSYEGGGFPLKTSGPRETPKQEEVPFPYGGQSFMYDNGAGYKMDRAKELGYTPDATGHMPSRDYITGEYLKDKYYPTSWKSNQVDQLMDYQVYQDGESLYSRPNVKANGGWLDSFDDGGHVHPHEDSRYSLPTYSSTVGSEAPRASINTPTEKPRFETEQERFLRENAEALIANTPASGTAEYFPLEAMLLPGTPAVKGLGKTGNFVLDALNPLGGMGKTPGLKAAKRAAAPIVEPFRYVPEGQTRVSVKAKKAPEKKAPEGVIEKTTERLKNSSVNPFYYKNQLKDIKKTTTDLDYVKKLDDRIWKEQEAHQKAMDAFGKQEKTANQRINKLGNVYWNKHDAGELGKDFPLTADQRSFVKHYPGYASYLTNKPGEIVGGFNKFAYQNKPSYLAEHFAKEKDVNELFSEDLVKGFLDKNTKSVRGIKNAPDEKTAKEWLTSLGDTKAKDRSLGNLGDAVYSSNSRELGEAFSRGQDVSGNYGADLKLNIKGMSDDLSPVEKVNLYEQQVRHGTDLVSIPGEKGFMSITQAAREGHGKALKDQGIRAIDKEYSHQAERGILDDSIIKLENLIDMSHAGTARPVGQGGMWGSGTTASEDLFDYVNKIQYKKNIFRSSAEGLEWTNKYKKVVKDLEEAKLKANKSKLIEDKLDTQKSNYRWGVLNKKLKELENNKYNLELELKDKINSLKRKSVLTAGVTGTYYGGKYLMDNQVERAREAAKKYASLSPEEKEDWENKRKQRRNKSRKNGGWLDTY